MPNVLDSFVKTCYPGIEFVTQNYCDDELKMVVNHVLTGGERRDDASDGGGGRLLRRAGQGF